MIQKTPVLRMCISCKKTYDRKNLLKITKDFKHGILLKMGMGRSAYICKSKNCYSDSKIKKKLQKALKTFLKPELIDILKKKLQATIAFPIKEYN